MTCFVKSGVYYLKEKVPFVRQIAYNGRTFYGFNFLMIRKQRGKYE